MPDDLAPSRTVYRFGVFEVDGRAGEVRKQGRALKLRGRPIDILLLLLVRRGDVISREELRGKLWPADTFVDFDHGLNSAMNRLRDALGDSAESPRFIETLPKRGYRFIAPIEVVEPGAVPVAIAPAVVAPSVAPPAPTAAADERPAARHIVISAPSRVVLLIATGALAVAVVAALLYLRIGRGPDAPAKMTLAVLPFENLSKDADQDFLSDGFTEEMIAELGKLDPEHLGVIARTTTRLYKNVRKNIGQIRQELGVDYVLEGSIRRAGTRVRIIAELVQTRDMTHLWAETYDRDDVSDVLTVQSEVAMKIAHSLALALHPATGARASASSPAYELYLRGRYFRDQATEESTRKAIEYYQRAVAADPKNPLAYAGLADAYGLLGAPGWEVDAPMTLLGKARASAERALEIDPRSPEAHAVMGLVRLNYQWDRAASERELQQAIALNPSFAQAHQYYSTALTTMGRFDDAIREARRAMELDPLSAPATTTLGIRYLYSGRYAEASEQFTKTIADNPEFAVAHWGLAQCLRQSGDASRELAELRRAVDLSGKSAYMRAHLAYGLAAAGDSQQATAIRRELELEGRDGYQAPYHIALIAAGLDDRDGTLHALERAFADRSGWLMFLPVEPEFARVRQTPEFQRLLARVMPQK
jgi:TolB-like protein/DNA-binding winged helix-turn-helix (wHTH) protein/tetratricopeptide (TPR) repeat protein